MAFLGEVSEVSEPSTESAAHAFVGRQEACLARRWETTACPGCLIAAASSRDSMLRLGTFLEPRAPLMHRCCVELPST
eukprot:2019579-Pyramimonas_sp.AAC.1